MEIAHHKASAFRHNNAETRSLLQKYSMRSCHSQMRVRGAQARASAFIAQGLVQMVALLHSRWPTVDLASLIIE